MRMGMALYRLSSSVLSGIYVQHISISVTRKSHVACV